jgi:hypothetical protein
MYLSSVLRVKKAVDMRVCGVTANALRRDSGKLTEGLEVFDGHKLGLFEVNGV